MNLYKERKKRIRGRKLWYENCVYSLGLPSWWYVCVDIGKSALTADTNPSRHSLILRPNDTVWSMTLIFITFALFLTLLYLFSYFFTEMYCCFPWMYLYSFNYFIAFILENFVNFFYYTLQWFSSLVLRRQYH